MKKVYRKEFDYGRQMRSFAMRLCCKNSNVKVLSQEFDKNTNKHILTWCYK